MSCRGSFIELQVVGRRKHHETSTTCIQIILLLFLVHLDQSLATPMPPKAHALGMANHSSFLSHYCKADAPNYIAFTKINSTVAAIARHMAGEIRSIVTAVRQELVCERSGAVGGTGGDKGHCNGRQPRVRMGTQAAPKV